MSSDQIKTIIQTKTKDTLITASKDKFISIIDIEKRAVVHSFSPLDSNIKYKRLYFGTNNNCQGPITVAALSNSGTYLAYGTLEPYYRVIELKTKQEKFNLDKTFNRTLPIKCSSSSFLISCFEIRMDIDAYVYS